MSVSRDASSEAAWALLTEGVTAARLEAHRLRHLVTRGQKLIDESSRRDLLYQFGGDIILAVPKRLQALEILLDRTSFALAKMGDSFLSARLPLSEKALVEETINNAGFHKHQASIQRVARRWVRKLGES